MNSKTALTLFVLLSVAGLVWVSLRDSGSFAGSEGVYLTPRQADSLFPCSYYPGQVSDAGTIGIMREYADIIVLARIETFELGESGFDWSVVLRTAEVIKGQGDGIYKPILQIY